MALSERAVLVAELQLVDKFSKNVNKALGGLKKVDAAASRTGKGFYTLGAGIGTAIRRGAFLAIGALGTLSAFVALSVKEGQEAAEVQLIYAKAIENSAQNAKQLKEELSGAISEQRMAKPDSTTYNKLGEAIDQIKAKLKVIGPVTAKYTAILNEQQTALMNLSGVDDELIKTEQTRLIQMGLNGKAVAALTPLILDASKATGKDLLQVTVAVGKAINGNVGGLARYGIMIDKARAKTDPFGAVLDALKSKFEGTTRALSGSFDVRLAVLRENLANIREDIGIKLLPALTRIVDVAGKSLVPAFQKFVDRILPDISKGIEDFAAALEGGGAEKAINGIGDALGSVIDLLKIAAGPVKMIVGAFMSLPKELQTILIGGFAINKLSGGLIGQGLGQILGGAFSRGSSPVNPMYVADVTGGLGGGLAGKGGKGLLGMLTSLPVLIGAAVVAGVSAITWENVVMPRLQEQGAANNAAATEMLRTGSLADLQNSLRGLEQMPDKLSPLQRVLYDLNASGIKTHTEALEAAIRAEIRSREQRPLTPGEIASDRQGANWDRDRPRGEHAGRASNATRAGIIQRVMERTGRAPTADRVTAILNKTRAASDKGNGLLYDLKAVTRTGDDVMAGKIASLSETTRSGLSSTAQASRDVAAAIRSKDFSPVFSPTINVSTGFTVRTLNRSTTIHRSFNPRTGIGNRNIDQP